MKKPLSLTLFILFACFFYSKAQFDPAKVVAPDFYSNIGSEYRSASGKPGPQYWQNRADYRVTAAFDTSSLALQGHVEILYCNNSPDVLDQLWLQLDQNNNAPTARANQMLFPAASADPTKGYVIKQVSIWEDDQWKPISYLVQDTRMQIRLADRPLTSGNELRLAIDYHYTLQERSGGGRSGFLHTKNGTIFEFSYWYPRLCVYDDYYGWNTLPFIGSGEMYLDYGDIDYAITIPANMVAVGTGKLINKEEVLSPSILERLNKAAQSDKPLVIRSSSELKQGITKAKSGTVTWHFNMQNTRDVAWAISNAYIWDAARINLPSGKTALAQSVYPIESTQDSIAWQRSTEMVKYSIEHYSNKWFEFPYATATSVAGSVGGMEFPGMAFNSWKAKPYSMFLLASHEIGHSWFPMIVGSDERRYPFMDEGFNTFINILAQESFNKGEFAPKRDGEYAPGGGNPADEIVQVIAESGEANTLMTPPDAMERKYVHPLAYFKSAFGLILLRDVILGPDRFDYAFRQYIHHWAFKHPRPVDFFHAIENGAGEDLSWFWRGWYYHNWQLDQAVKQVAYVDGNMQKGATITVENKQQMVMPILAEVKEENGKSYPIKVPVEVWQRGKEASFTIPSTSKIVSIILDPNHLIPDMDRSNNEWKP